MAEEHTHTHHHHQHHHHHHHHHDIAQANADHFSQHASSYRTEFSLEAAKRIAAVVRKNYPFDSNQTEVLDFACGPGLIAFELLPYAKSIVGADLAPGMIDVFNKTVEEQGISSDKLRAIKIDPLKGDPSDLNGLLFDVIFCAQAYHHFEDPTHITRALAQHLKPKGRLFIIDFVDDEDTRKFFDTRCEHDAAHTVPHKHGFSSERLIDMLKAGGLQNPQVQNAFSMTKSEIKSYKGHEVFGKIMESDLDFTLSYFIASGDK